MRALTPRGSVPLLGTLAASSHKDFSLAAISKLIASVRPRQEDARSGLLGLRVEAAVHSTISRPGRLFVTTQGFVKIFRPAMDFTGLNFSEMQGHLPVVVLHRFHLKEGTVAFGLFPLLACRMRILQLYCLITPEPLASFLVVY